MRHKQQLDGKIPEKYNSRTAKMYNQELLVSAPPPPLASVSQAQQGPGRV